MSEATAQKDADKVSTETPTVSQSTIDKAAESVAGLEQLGMLDKGSLAKIEAIEKKIFYRRFYFPGGKAEKRLPGLGTDKPGEYKYDQLPGDRYVMDSWDPRYLDDYITQARQNGFHKHFIYFDGTENKHMSFDDASKELKDANESGNFKEGTERAAVGIVVGLMYMGKLGIFCQEYGKKIGFSSALLQKTIAKYPDYHRDATSSLVALIGQSCSDITREQSEFVKNDSGWLAEDNKYAFDISQYAAEWNAMQKEYNEYKEKIWNILKGVKNLNLCTNINKGIQVGNVNIQQQMECVQKVTSAATIDNSTKAPEAPTPQIPLSPVPVIPTPAPAPSPAQMALQETPAPAQQTAAPAQDPAPAKSSNTMYIIIAVAVIGVILVFGIVFAMTRKSGNEVGVIQNSYMPVAMQGPMPGQMGMQRY